MSRSEMDGWPDMRVVIALIGLFLPSLCLAQSPAAPDPAPPAATPGLLGFEDVAVLVLGLAAAGVVWRLQLTRVGKEPRPLPPAAPRSNSAIPQLLLLGLVVWIGQGVAGAALMQLWSSPPGTTATLRQLGMVAGAAYLSGIALAAGLLAAFRYWPAAAIGVQPTWASIRAGVGSAILILPVVAFAGVIVALVSAIVSESPPPAVAHDTLQLLAAGPNASPEPDNRGGWWWLLVAGVVLGAPIVEELIYRGCLQTSLALATRSRAIGIVATSVVFTGVHMGIADFRALPMLFVLSLGLGVCYERSGRLLTPILVHALFNAANVATAVLQNSP